mgnify:CR=1 FL=1
MKSDKARSDRPAMLGHYKLCALSMKRARNQRVIFSSSAEWRVRRPGTGLDWRFR